MFNLDFIIFRPHNVYGERQNIGDKYRNVVGIFMNQVLQNKPMTIFGNGEQTRAFSYIGDVAPVLAESIEVPEARNQVFNIGADKPCSVNDLAIAVAKAFDIQIDIIYLPTRKEVIHAYSSHEKIRRIFGDRRVTSLQDGLHRMAEWAKVHGARTSSEFSDIEIVKNLPEAWLS